MTKPKATAHSKAGEKQREMPEDSRWVPDAEGAGVVSPLGSWYRSKEPKELANLMNYAFSEGIITGKAIERQRRERAEKALDAFTQMRTDAPGFVRAFTMAVLAAEEALEGDSNG